MPTQMQSPPSWSDGDILYATALTTGFSNITTYANAYMAWLAANQTWTGTNTFNAAVTTAAGITVNTTGLTVAPQTALTFTHASARILPGATGLYFRDTANSADNLGITDAGVVTVRGGLTVTAGGATVSSGGITVTGNSTITGTLSGITTMTVTTMTASTFAGGAAASKLLIGSASLSIKDSTDASTIMSITPSAITVATGIGFTAPVTGGGGLGLVVGSNVTLHGTALATNATTGFVVMPSMAGTPTGNMGAGFPAGGCPMVIDTTGSKIWVNMGGTTWKSVAVA